VRALLTRTWNRLLAAAVFQRFIEPPIVSGVTHSLTSIHIFLGSFDRLSILSPTRIASSTRTALQPSLMAVTQFRLLIPVIALHSSQPRKRRLTPMSSDANANHTPTTCTKQVFANLPARHHPKLRDNLPLPHTITIPASPNLHTIPHWMSKSQPSVRANLLWFTRARYYTKLDCCGTAPLSFRTSDRG
jgi:hypothetical protein